MQSWMLLAAISAVLTFALTLLMGIRRIRTDIFNGIKKELTSDFVSTGYCKTCTTRTCQKLDDINEKLEQGSKEFLVIRLIFMEAKLVPREKIEEIRNTVMDGG